MKVLVTGGAGYLRVVLVPRLLEAGYQVRVLDNLILGGEGLLPVYSHPRFEFILADLRESEAVAAALTDVEAVIHLAALVGDAQCEDRPEAAWAGHTNTVKALLNAGAEVDAKDDKGKTTLMRATEKGHAEIVQLLKQAGAKE